MISERQKSENIVSEGTFYNGMKKMGILVLAALMLGCQEENIPAGFYDYQIIRLLASDSSKVWYRTQYVENGNVSPVTTCQDSVFVSFLFAPRLNSNAKDSAYFYELIPKPDCSALDTILIGKFTASSIDNVFTDTLNFKEGPIDFMLLDNITSRFTKLIYERDGVNISASFEAVQ